MIPIPLYDDMRRRGIAWVTLLLIVLNAAVFVAWQRRVGLGYSARELGLYREDIIGPVGLTQQGLAHVFTYMFLHEGWLHLLGNMWFLWVFGVGVEYALGSFRFFLFYLLCGVLAAIVFVEFSSVRWLPLVGASGAISGVLGAYLALYARRARIITLIPLIIIVRIIAIPAWVFLLVWIALQIVEQAAVSPTVKGGVAYVAHIGGFGAGLILVRLFQAPRSTERARERS